jgi:hypothetical protein
MTHKQNHINRIGSAVDSKRTPLKPSGLKSAKILSLSEKKQALRKSDLTRHSHHSRDGENIIEIRDKQADTDDISPCQIKTKRTDLPINNFYNGSQNNELLKGAAGDNYLNGRDGNEILIGNAGKDSQTVV